MSKMEKNAFGTSKLSTIRHTTAHLLAQAVKRLYPDVKLAVGPATEQGFYYDFDFMEPFREEHLITIEAEMKKIVREHLEINMFTLPREEAIQKMQENGEDYKVWLIRDLPEGAKVTFYKQGEFVDLCAGPHLANTKDVKAFRLTSVAGSYWRGDEKNQMLTRIYGTAFKNQSDLDAYLKQMEEAKKRDHRKLGKELGIYAMFDEGPGFPFFLPKGTILKNILVDYWRRLHTNNGYSEVSTPILLEQSLWAMSGHWEHYKENMYSLKLDNREYVVKPMSCPGGMLVYQSTPRSYRELPLRMAELGLVHRHEKSGALHGLMRVRAFTQDDVHIFLTKEQITEVIKENIRLIGEVYRKFGFPYQVELSTRPKNSMGSDEDWEVATNGLRNALEEMGMSYQVNEGDGAFYGPKIDFHLTDSLHRTWQCGTIQLDFQLPLRFQAEYVEKDGSMHRPILIHRAIFGSLERFIGILIEHYAGRFPVWLAPVQVAILPISHKYMDYANVVGNQLRSHGIRYDIDNRDETLGNKIRKAQSEKVPYMLILGEKELGSGQASVRDGITGKTHLRDVDDFILELRE